MKGRWWRRWRRLALSESEVRRRLYPPVPQVRMVWSSQIPKYALPVTRNGRRIGKEYARWITTREGGLR